MGPLRLAHPFCFFAVSNIPALLPMSEDQALR